MNIGRLRNMVDNLDSIPASDQLQAIQDILKMIVAELRDLHQNDWRNRTIG